jgi:CubicO group peptidase (beta-lactamase class C family)
MPALAVAAPETIGLNPARLNRLHELLTKWTASGEVPSAAFVMGRGERMIAPRYFGRMGPEADAAPIRDDGLFLMASITKPIVYLGAMLLVERGQLTLTDRVTRYLPDFAAHHKDATLILHLFTHTSGLPDYLANNVELRKAHAPLAKYVEHGIRDTVPLFAPGTKLSYQSVGTNLVAELIRVIDGRPIAQFLREEIFTPLGLQSTGLGSQGFARERLIRCQVPEYQDPSFGWNSVYWQELGAPWGGLFSTPGDFAVLCRVMLGGGAVGGVRIAAPATVAAMTRNWLTSLPELPEAVARTQPWGLGWRLNHPGTDDSWGELLGPRVFGHTGATGTLVWMDPESDVFCVLLTNAIRAAQPWRLKQLSNLAAAAIDA